jgi:hypothetical protein
LGFLFTGHHRAKRKKDKKQPFGHSPHPLAAIEGGSSQQQVDRMPIVPLR